MRRIICKFVVLCIVPAAIQTARAAQNPKPQAQAAGGVEAAPPKFHVLRSVSGTKGEQTNGTYVIQDPRSVFYLGQDHQVIVYFEWQGPPGPHHFEGIWKNPDGKINALSDFDYEAKQNRFAGFWQLLIADTTQTGMWTLEARVDGEMTGVHTFQILNGSNPNPVIPGPALLTPSQLYQRLEASTVTIEKRSPQGEIIGRGLGFFVSPGLVLTAFQVIDGAGLLRVRVPGGQNLETKEIAAWNRRQDWALLKLGITETSVLPIAKLDSAAVGDRCVYLDTAGPNNRVIVETNVVGKELNPSWGDRLDLANMPAGDGYGSALLNEHGEAIGVVGGSLLPGVSAIEALRMGYNTNLLAVKALMQSGMATPIWLVPRVPDKSQESTLDQLTASGQFVPPLMWKEDVVSGTLTKSLPKDKSKLPSMVDDKFEYTRADKRAYIFLILAPKQKRKGFSSILIYNLDNRMLGQSQPAKVSLDAGETKFWSAEFPLSNLSPGVYRVDLVLDGTPFWRTYFRISE